MAPRAKAVSEVIGPEPTNGAKPDIELELPYVVEFTIEGVCPILFHAWNNEAVAEKAVAKKGSAAKKSDNVESYVYRTAKKEIALPGVYVHSSMQYAAKFKQDPRSPRKSSTRVLAPRSGTTSTSGGCWCSGTRSCANVLRSTQDGRRRCSSSSTCPSTSTRTSSKRC